MAQKINPTSFRLGVTQFWDSNLQVYGKSFNFYFYVLHKYLQIYKYLIKFFSLNNFLLDCQEWKISNSGIILNIYYLKLPFQKILNYENFFNKILKLTNQWFFTKIKICFYLKSSWSPSTNLIVAYTRYLMDTNSSSKKIILNLSKFLESHLGSKKLSYFKFGILKLQLKGFRIKISGRFDESKTQMAKSFEHSVGYLPLTSLKSYVEYSNKEIYTKSGICGLKIWLFYELD